jgi:hypothetical protein
MSRASSYFKIVRMPMNWIPDVSAIGRGSPTGPPAVNVAQFLSVMGQLRFGSGVGAYFGCEDEVPKAAIRRIEQELPERRDFINALIYAEHDLKDVKLFRRLAQQAAESGQLYSCGNHLANRLVRKSFLGDPNGLILDDSVHVDLLECAAMHPETGTGEGSEAAESAFDLGVYFSGRSEDSKAGCFGGRGRSSSSCGKVRRR